MNMLKKIFAAALVLVMALSVVGCHPKNEVAVTIGDVEFTSAYYMVALLMADSEARSKVDEALKEKEEAESSSSADSTSSETATPQSDESVDYYSQKVEDTDYVKWVKNKALESLKQIAAYKIKCKEAKLELEDDVAANAEQYASYYWSSYGYSQMFEPNGVSQSTYTQYMKDGYYSSLYFEHLYGKDGDKEIAADTVKAKLLENYILADKLEVSFSEKEEADITALKEKVQGYETALKNGTMTFEQVYKDYNGNTDEEEATPEEDTDELKPLDKYSSVIGAADTDYAADYFDTVKAMAVGEIKIIDLANNGGIVLVVKQEMSADPYYMDNLDIPARHLIEGDNYTKDMEDYAKSLKADVSNYAINQFNVKKIIYPEQQQTA